MAKTEVVYDTFVVYDKNTGEKVGYEGYMEEDLDAVEQYLKEPGKYIVQLRCCTECSGYTYHEAYELAMKHPEGMFDLVEDCDTGVNKTAKDFMNWILSYIADEEGIDDWTGEELPFTYDSWNDEIDGFVWDHILVDNEIIDVCIKYGIEITS